MSACLSAIEIEVTRAGVALLRRVDVEVTLGKIVAVLGPSGAGKTSLFRVLVGEDSPDAGRVLLDGTDITARPLWRRARRGVGYLPQGPSVLFDLTVEENLLTFLAIATSAQPTSRPPSAASLMERVELTTRRKVRAGALSGGERRRLEIARALCGSPRVLIVDEPFSGVDPAGARRLATLLRSLADEGVAIALSDHHIDEALSIADQAVLLIDGAIELAGTPDELLAHPLARSRYLAPAR